MFLNAEIVQKLKIKGQPANSTNFMVILKKTSKTHTVCLPPSSICKQNRNAPLVYLWYHSSILSNRNSNRKNQIQTTYYISWPLWPMVLSSTLSLTTQKINFRFVIDEILNVFLGSSFSSFSSVVTFNLFFIFLLFPLSR